MAIPDRTKNRILKVFGEMGFSVTFTDESVILENYGKQAILPNQVFIFKKNQSKGGT